MLEPSAWLACVPNQACDVTWKYIITFVAVRMLCFGVDVYDDMCVVAANIIYNKTKLNSPFWGSPAIYVGIIRC